MKKQINLFTLFFILIVSLLYITTQPLINNNEQDIGDAYYLLLYWIFWGIILFISSAIYLSKYFIKKNRIDILKFWTVLTIIITMVSFGSIKMMYENYQYSKKAKAEYLVFKKQYLKRKKEKENQMLNKIKKTKTAQSYYDFGHYLRTEGKWQHAIKYLTIANKLDSLNSEYHAELAYCLCGIEIGRYDESLESYKTAYNIDPKEWILKEIERCNSLKKQYSR